jgi:ABC-type transport system involved in cytochrome c biogenesis permease component
MTLLGASAAVLAPLLGFLVGSASGSPEGDPLLSPLYWGLFIGVLVGGVGVVVAAIGGRRLWLHSHRDHREGAAP